MTKDEAIQCAKQLRADQGREALLEYLRAAKESDPESPHADRIEKDMADPTWQSPGPRIDSAFPRGRRG